MTTFNLPSPSPLLVSPTEPESTGLCQSCGEDFGERAFEINEWPEVKDEKWCFYCVITNIRLRLQRAENFDNSDILPILQSVDEITRCKDCDMFVCGCP